MELDISRIKTLAIETSFLETKSLSEFTLANAPSKWVKGKASYKQYELGYVSSSGGNFIPEWWSLAPCVLQNEITYFKYTNGYYLPEIGGLLNHDLEMSKLSYEEASFLYGINPATDSSFSSLFKNKVNKEFQNKSIVVTMPWGAIHNYGHFLLDCFPAAYQMSLDLDSEKHVFVFPDLKTYQRDYLKLIGILWIEVRGVHAFKEVVYSNLLDHYLHFPGQPVLEMKEKILENISRLRKSQESHAHPKQIFLIRKDQSKRNFTNEEELGRKLNKVGFTTVDPSNLNVIEQIELFQNVDVIVGASGAAFANIIWSKPGTKVIDIQSQNAQQVWIRNLSLVNKLKYAPYFVQTESNSSAPIVGGIARPEMGFSFEMELIPFIEYLSDVIEM
jgi:hypothetical protein